LEHRICSDSSQAAHNHSGDYLWIVRAASHLDREYERSLDGGWGYPEIWMAPLRLTVCFVMVSGFIEFTTNSIPQNWTAPTFRLFLWCAFRCTVLESEWSLVNGLYERHACSSCSRCHPLWGALECRRWHDQALQVSGRLSYPLYINSHSFRICPCRLLVTRHPSVDVKLIWISCLFHCDLCGLDCSEVLRRAVRAWLTRRYGISGVSASSQSPLNRRSERSLENTMGRTSKRTRCSAGQILMLVLALTVTTLRTGTGRLRSMARSCAKTSAGTPIVGAKVR